MTKIGLEILITILLLSSLFTFFEMYTNPSDFFAILDRIYIESEWTSRLNDNGFYKEKKLGTGDIISSQDNMFMIYKNILLILSFFSCICLICLSYLVSKK